MYHHRLFRPRLRLRTFATLFVATLSFTHSPGLLAQLPGFSSSLANLTQPLPNCTDLSESPCPPPPPTPAPRHPAETSLSLGAFAQITPTRLQTNVYGTTELGTQTQGIAPTPGILGTFRQQFHPWLGYSLNMGYTRVDERYTYSPSTPAGSDLHIPTNLYEISLSYVAQKHLTPRLTGFADLGAGAVVALPTNHTGTPVSPEFAYIHPPVNYRPEGTTGFGLDLRLAQHLDFRAEYRGLLYKNPDFGGLQKSTTWTSEPTLSLVYRFGKKEKARDGSAHP